MKRPPEDKADALSHTLGRALIIIYGTTKAPERAWERIAAHLARPCRAGDRGRYRTIQPLDPMLGLDPQLGPTPTPPRRR